MSEQKQPSMGNTVYRVKDPTIKQVAKVAAIGASILGAISCCVSIARILKPRD